MKSHSQFLLQPYLPSTAPTPPLLALSISITINVILQLSQLQIPNMRNKGKVHPFTSSNFSSFSSSSPNKDSPLSVLKLLPAAIFTLVSVLSLEEREALAFMITRSLKSTNLSFCPAEEDTKKIPKKKQSLIDSRGHSSPACGLFECDCFDCYTTFWFRWDSSPNRELIHQAIEAFEDHLNNKGDQFNKTGNGKKKRKEKSGRRKFDKKMMNAAVGDGALDVSAAEPPENQERIVLVSPENEVATAEADYVKMKVDAASPPTSAVVQNHKGFARKMLPDVMGILNSRLWSLWSPNV